MAGLGEPEFEQKFTDLPSSMVLASDKVRFRDALNEVDNGGLSDAECLEIPAF